MLKRIGLLVAALLVTFTLAGCPTSNTPSDCPSDAECSQPAGGY